MSDPQSSGSATADLPEPQPALSATASGLPASIGVTVAAEAAPVGPRRAGRFERFRSLRTQLGVAVGQGTAGLGNMLFSLVAVRLLQPEAYAQLATFLALYLVVNLPANGLSALTALRPDGQARARRLVAGIGLGVGLAVAAGAPWLAPATHLTVPLLLCLAAVCPVAPLLAMARGRLYGWGRHVGLVVSLLSEPAVRLSLGLVLAQLAGANGAAFGAVAGGLTAFEVARRAGRRVLGSPPSTSPLPASVPLPSQLVAMATFVLLGVAQNLDLLMSNRLLGSAAPTYAALSTLGGMVAFATATIPLVLLPQARRGEKRALGVALSIAGAIGVAAALAALPDPGLVVRVLVGSRYHQIAPLLAMYFAAMACFGVARVLAAHNLGLGRLAPAVTPVALGVAGQAIAILMVPRRVEDVAVTTVVTMSAVAIAEAGVAVAGSGLLRRAAAALTTPAGLVVATATLVGTGIRLYIPRGIWLDEATSIFEARLPFMRMIAQLYNHDVHPPLYFSLLWVDIRMFGSDQFGVRILSIIFGIAIVPMAYVAGRDMFDRRTGMVASALAVVAPLMVWYSQEARMYSMFMFFALVAVWAQAMAMRRGHRRDWTIWVLASAALGWTEYFGLFQVVCQWLIFAVLAVRWRGRPDRASIVRPWLVSSAILLLLMAPLIPFAYHQFIVNQDAGKGFGGPSQVGSGAAGGAVSVNVYTVLANILWAAVGYHSNAVMAKLGALWPLGILASLLILGRRHRGETKLVVACMVGPLLLDVGFASAKPYLLDVRYISGLPPLMVLLAARVVTGCARRRAVVVGCCALVTVALSIGLVDQQFNGSNPRRYDFQRALQGVNHQFRRGDLLVYDPPDLGQVVSYYSPNDRRHALNSAHLNPPPHGVLFVLESPPLMNQEANRYRLHLLVVRLRHDHAEIRRVAVPNVIVWEFRR